MLLLETWNCYKPWKPSGTGGEREREREEGGERGGERGGWGAERERESVCV